MSNIVSMTWKEAPEGVEEQIQRENNFTAQESEKITQKRGIWSVKKGKVIKITEFLEIESDKKFFKSKIEKVSCWKSLEALFIRHLEKMCSNCIKVVTGH